MTRSERVAGVDANANSLRLLDTGHNGRQMFEAPPQATALPRGVFKQSQSPQAWQIAMNQIHRRDHAFDALLFAAGGIGSRMYDQAGNSERLCPHQLFREGFHRLLPQHRIRTGEIDEIGSMRGGVPDSAAMKG